MIKLFDGGSEVRLTHDAVKKLIQHAFNDGFFDGEYEVTALTMHPGNKYVIRMTVQPPAKKTGDRK